MISNHPPHPSVVTPLKIATPLRPPRVYIHLYNRVIHIRQINVNRTLINASYSNIPIEITINRGGDCIEGVKSESECLQVREKYWKTEKNCSKQKKNNKQLEKLQFSFKNGFHNVENIGELL